MVLSGPLFPVGLGLESQPWGLTELLFFDSPVPVPSTPAAAPASSPAQKAVPAKVARGEGPEPRGARAGPQELGKILQGVVVVLSGFQNPFRSELRDKALELGAKYRPDWTPDSTHLM